MFQASAVMTTEVITVHKSTDIYEAIRAMAENNITGLPVVNDDMTLAGIVTEKDVLKLLYNMEDRPGEVKDFMTEEIVAFDQDDNVVDIAECLIENHFRRVPILAEGKLAGIVSRKDIISYILKLRHKDKATV
jgi:CBS domain-containing protein